MAIDITIKNYRSFTDEDPGRFRIADGFTAFVGPNNSGKSSLLRLFYELRVIFGELTTLGNWQQVIVGGKTFEWAKNVRDNQEPFSRFNERPMSFLIQVSETVENDAVSTVELIIERPPGQNLPRYRINPASLGLKEGSLQGFDISGFDPRYEGGVIGSIQALVDAFRSLQATMYIPAFRNPINAGAASYFDVEVGTGFIQRWDSFQAGPPIVNQKASADVVESIRQLFGFDQFGVIASSDNQTLSLTIDNEPFSLGEVGAGLAHLIMTLVNAAVKQPTYLLIDEPELGLHPSLQMEFLTSLGALASKGVIFATHSYGLARSTGDLIFSVSQGEDRKSHVRPLETTPRLSEFVEEMSFSAYRELGFDRILLVEGPSEVKQCSSGCGGLKRTNRS